MRKTWGPVKKNPAKYPARYPAKYPAQYPTKYPAQYPARYPAQYIARYPAQNNIHIYFCPEVLPTDIALA